MTQEYMLQEVAPRLRAGIGSSIPRAGGEDDSELFQDGLVIALGLLRSAQTNGKQVSPGNLAYYTIKHLRAGRRSTGTRKNDPLHAAAQLNQCQVYSLDEPVPVEHGEDLTLNDVLAAARMTRTWKPAGGSTGKGCCTSSTRWPRPSSAPSPTVPNCRASYRP